MALIEVDGLSIDFPLYHGNSRSLKKTVFAAASGRLGEDQQHRRVVRAVRDVSFRLKHGDRLGLVGRNGAGKTTLLRALAGIYEPVVGHLHVEGAVVALLDSGLGMNPELSGRENILLRGLTLGLDRAAIRAIEADVQEFAGLGDFLELPVRLYSTGMVVRLGFALATAIRPQVLIMDEWILAGDADFMARARGRLEDMVRGAEILVLSSHSPEVIGEWCTRVMRMDEGRVVDDGPAEDVLRRYLGPSRDTAPSVPDTMPGAAADAAA
ncbi:MAG TPA: ABC transporter ATP-binding protein [Acetobacteraceae bacterium]|nr:ABC transporter ATP-binding protein [Acetobacteraceae bacterium]